METLESKAKLFLKKASINESTVSALLGALVVAAVTLLITNYLRYVTAKPQITDSAAQTVNENLVSLEQKKEDFPRAYVVKEGESLWSIAESEYGNGEAWTAIAEENNLLWPNVLSVSMELTLPKVNKTSQGEVLSAEFIEAFKEDSYVVQEGDSLWKISMKAYGTGEKWTEIAAANTLSYPDYLLVGSSLVIPR